MPRNDYSPQQALQSIMQKLSKANINLFNTVQAAVDAGRDVQAAEPTDIGRSGTREYRKTVPYTFEEAIAVAIRALEAYFVVSPLMRNSSADNFLSTAIGLPRRSSFKIERHQRFGYDDKSIGTEKMLQIELRTETQLLPDTQALRVSEEVYSLSRVSEVDIHTEEENLAHLRDLLKFD
jgi:hypothetical protein